MLYASSGAPADPYKTAVIDTIVAEVQSVPGEDRCVLLLGYKDQMEEMFQVRMKSSRNLAPRRLLSRMSTLVSLGVSPSRMLSTSMIIRTRSSCKPSIGN